MPSLQAELLVIGGGATGAGVAWDAALRGFDVVLVDRADLAEGTSGRFHGLLHSGGRYVVKDPVAAEECVVENAILRRVIPDCIEDTGGLFVVTPDDDPDYGDEFLAGLPSSSLPVEELDVAEALRREPRLNPGIKRAFAVPDASIDAWKTVWSFARGASAHGARILPYHRVARPAPRQRCGHRRARSQRAHGRGARHRGGIHHQRLGRVGGPDRRAWRGSRAWGWCPARAS